nr:CDPK-related kinase 3 [Tanacetum cinerariifolium]
KEIKEMVTRVAVEQRRELHLKKNDKVRVRCICRGKVPQFGCEDGDDDSGSKGVVSSGSKGKGQSKKVKAKKMAQERVEGNHTRQYAQLRDYCLELKNNNPNTTIKIKVEPPEDINSTKRKFKRVYVCLGALKDGFKAGKRNLLRLDGCFLSGKAHCDVLLNNMCEVFNRQLVDGRDKPIITCLKFIREYLMKRIVNVQKHALAAIWDMAGNEEETAIPESYCHQVHWLSTWKDMYKFKVNPCNGPAFWEKSTIPNTIVPPKIHPQIGRLPKKRKKSAAELAEGMVKGNKLSKAALVIFLLLGTIPEDGTAAVEQEVQLLDKNFGYNKNFGAKYELGKEIGRGHFGHTCHARGKKGDLKDLALAVKIISKVKEWKITAVMVDTDGGGEMIATMTGGGRVLMI